MADHSLFLLTVYHSLWEPQLSADFRGDVKPVTALNEDIMKKYAGAFGLKTFNYC